jgi:hypothetical protein
VNGVVTVDGKPVEGATVTFISEKGDQSFSGSTNANGEFSLASGQQLGAYPGNYKVLVVKSPTHPTDEALDPSSPDVMKQMKKETESIVKAATPTGNDPKSKMMKGAGGSVPLAPGATIKSVLPHTYAKLDTTPLTAKVPSETPITLELKSKP